MSTTTKVSNRVAVLHAVTNRLDVDALAALPLDEQLRAWHMLEETNRVLALVRSQLTQRLAEQLPEKQVVVEGVGVFVRHGKRDRTQWDKDALLSAVLDSRLVDRRTGEVVDESPLEKVRHVWNLGAPRVTALRDRGIDPDQFCRSEWGGWGIEVL